MRKTIDLTNKDIEIVKEYQKRNGLKNFSEGVRYIVRNMGSVKKASKKGLSDENFALLGDAILQLDGKLDHIQNGINDMLPNIAPKKAGEVK